MYYSRKKIVLVFFVFCNLFAGTDGTIRGQILDTEGDPAIGAQVVIKKNGIGTAADLEGNYLTRNDKGE